MVVLYCILGLVCYCFIAAVFHALAGDDSDNDAVLCAAWPLTLIPFLFFIVLPEVIVFVSNRIKKVMNKLKQKVKKSKDDYKNRGY